MKPLAVISAVAVLWAAPLGASWAQDKPLKDAIAVAFFGSYTVNEGDKTIVMKLERGSNSSRDGSEQKLTVKSSTGDTLVLVGSPRKDQHGTFSPIFELRRAK